VPGRETRTTGATGIDVALHDGVPDPTAASAHQIPGGRLEPTRGHWRDWGTLLLAALALHCLGFLVWTLFGTRSAPNWVFVENLLLLPGGLVAAILAWRASTRSSLGPRSRRGWRLLTLAFSLWWLGDLLWFYYEGVQGLDPTPSWADLAYLLGYPPLLAGLLSFPTLRGTRAQRAIFWVDVAIVLLGGGMVAWYLLLSPAIQAASDPLTLLIGVAYPLADLALFGGIAVSVMSRLVDHRRAAARFLLAGLTLNLAIDLLFGIQLMQGVYGKVPWPSWLDLLAWCLLAAAALSQFHQPQEAPGRRRASMLFPWFPYAAIAVGYGVMFIQSQAGNREPLSGALIIGALLTGVSSERRIVRKSAFARSFETPPTRSR
jgi:hypothetical protein